jgi:hypothetical protein
VTPVLISTAKALYEAEDLTMTPSTRGAKNTPKPGSVVVSQCRSASCATAVKRSQPSEALPQALEALGLPEALVAETEGRLRSQHTLLGKIFGVMGPPLFGCRTSSELCRARGWDKNLLSRLRGALPQRSWIKRLRCLALEVLVPLWRDAASKGVHAEPLAMDLGCR